MLLPSGGHRCNAGWHRCGRGPLLAHPGTPAPDANAREPRVGNALAVVDPIIPQEVFDQLLHLDALNRGRKVPLSISPKRFFNFFSACHREVVCVDSENERPLRGYLIHQMDQHRGWNSADVFRGKYRLGFG
jgi:hypothetical protein